MNTSLELSTKPLSPEERQRALNIAKAQVAERNVIRLPQLKLKSAGGDAIEGVKDGEYYVKFQEENDKKETVTKIIPVGAHPEVHILMRLYSYAWYRKENKAKNLPGRLMAWTNELETFGGTKANGQQQDTVMVEFRDGWEQPMIRHWGSYQEFKSILEREFTDREGRKLLKFQNVLYVYLPVEGTKHTVFQFMISNSGVSGAPDGQDTGDYKNPEPGSLLSFINSIRSAEMGVLFGTKCRLGSRLHTGGKSPNYFLPLFENAGASELFDQMTDLYVRLGTFLDAKFENDFGTMNEMKTEDKSKGNSEIDATIVEETDFDAMPDVQ